MSESNEQQALANQRAYRHVVDKSKTGQAAPAFEEMLDTANPGKAPAWTHEYADDTGFEWRFRRENDAWILQWRSTKRTQEWSTEQGSWTTPESLKQDAKARPFPSFRVIREPAPTVEAPAWTAGAVKAWEDGCDPPCRMVELPDGTLWIINRAGERLRLERDPPKDDDGFWGAVPVLPAPEPTPQPEASRADLELCRGLLHRIRAWDQLPTMGDGPFWIREINGVLGNTDPAVEAQVVACADRREKPAPDRLSAEAFFNAVFDLLELGNVADRDIEWAVKIVTDLEVQVAKHPAMIAALKGRRA